MIDFGARDVSSTSLRHFADISSSLHVTVNFRRACDPAHLGNVLHRIRLLTHRATCDDLWQWQRASRLEISR